MVDGYLTTVRYTQHYGIQFRGFDTPCHEDMPRYEGPGAETLFYYRQEDDLMAVQQRTSRWHYNIIRPFGVVGFTNQCMCAGSGQVIHAKPNPTI